MSRLPNVPSTKLPINEHFLNEQLFAVLTEPWFTDIINYLVTKKILMNLSIQYKYKFHS